jgi:hypothetical protein
MAISYRGEGGVGGARGGSSGSGKLKVDKGAAKENEKIKTEVIQKRSVRVIPGTSKPRADYINAKAPKPGLKEPGFFDKVKKGGTVKINSKPAKSADAAKAAADAKALKAANKGKKR